MPTIAPNGLTKLSPVVGTGASASLVTANSSRTIVIVASAESNDPAAFDPTGGTCALDVGIPLKPGFAALPITGVAAQSAMTFIGSIGDKFTVYVG